MASRMCCRPMRRPCSARFELVASLTPRVAAGLANLAPSGGLPNSVECTFRDATKAATTENNDRMSNQRWWSLAIIGHFDEGLTSPGRRSGGRPESRGQWRLFPGQARQTDLRSMLLVQAEAPWDTPGSNANDSQNGRVYRVGWQSRSLIRQVYPD